MSSSDIMERMRTSLEASEELQDMSNPELAKLLLEHFWSKLDITSPQSALLHAVIERLQGP